MTVKHMFSLETQGRVTQGSPQVSQGFWIHPGSTLMGGWCRHARLEEETVCLKRGEFGMDGSGCFRESHRTKRFGVLVSLHESAYQRKERVPLGKGPSGLGSQDGFHGDGALQDLGHEELGFQVKGAKTGMRQAFQEDQGRREAHKGQAVHCLLHTHILGQQCHHRLANLQVMEVFRQRNCNLHKK